jgi:AraC family transcriptional regulator of adaptative response / DNA-3-methyladenine glycosylase II
MNKLTEQDYRKIIARRDRRFDGRFYFGVKTTRIYCRPSCPAKPKPENILVFKSLGEAEKMGFRPCMRCHPDLAPGNKSWEGTINTVSRALRIINDSSDAELTIETLAGSLGVTDRHLRRLFDEHLGASPIEIMITQRLHFAKQAIRETSAPVSEIAFASGFQSVRRFNEAFKTRFHKSPSDFRKTQGSAMTGTLTLRIPIRRPYDWRTVITYLKKHEVYGIESIGNGEYRRFIPTKDSFGTIVVSEKKDKDFLGVEFINIPLRDVRFIISRIKNLFDTDHNPLHLPAAKKLVPNGIRVPGNFDPFETAISIILGQLVSVEQAKSKLKALIQTFGRKIGDHESGEVFEFPSPATLATAEIEKIGMPKTRADAVREVSMAVADGSVNFRSHSGFSEAIDRLLAIRGIGPWTAAMIAMRCLGDPDAFPEADLIINRAIKKKLVNQADWASFRAYLTHCLWRDFGAALSKKRRKK